MNNLFIVVELIVVGIENYLGDYFWVRVCVKCFRCVEYYVVVRVDELEVYIEI